MPFASLFDALRRLPVVIGCVVLATAQPMSGSSPATPEPQRAPDQVIYPKGGSPSAQSASYQDIGYSSPVYLVFAVVVAATGAWILWRRRSGASLLPGKVGPQKLTIDETRPLGNRQYLVVAQFEGRRFLIGVTTDRIELLTHLPELGSDE